jgi:hypothetical protein
MARQSRVLTPYVSARHFLGSELRRWRLYRGISLDELGRSIYVSGAQLGMVEKAERRATAALITACDTALDTGGALAHLLGFAENFAPVADPQRWHPTASVLIQVMTDSGRAGDDVSLVYPDSGQGGAHVFRLADVRQRRRS